MSEARRLVQVILPPPPPNIDDYTPFAPEVTEIIEDILKDDERQRSKEADDTVNHVFSRRNTPNSSTLTTPLEPSTVRISPLIPNPPESLDRPKKMRKKARTVATRIITPMDTPSDEDHEPSLPPVKPRRVSTTSKADARAARSKSRSKQDAAPSSPSAAAEMSNNVQEHEVQGEDVIFSDVSESSKQDILIWIASHEFMQQPVQPVPLSARRRFADELQKEAKTNGLSEASIVSLVAYTRWTYLSVFGLSGSEIQSYTDHDAFGKEVDDTNLSSKSSESRKRRRSSNSTTQSKKQKLCSRHSSSSFHTADEDSNDPMHDALGLHPSHSPMEINDESQEQGPSERSGLASKTQISVPEKVKEYKEVHQQPSTLISAVNEPSKNAVLPAHDIQPPSTTKGTHDREIRSPLKVVHQTNEGAMHETCEPLSPGQQNTLAHQSLSPATRATNRVNATPSATSSPLKSHPWWLTSSVLSKGAVDVDLAREVSNSPLSSAGKKKPMPRLSSPFTAEKANEDDTLNVTVTHGKSQSPVSPASKKSILRRSTSVSHGGEEPGKGRARGVLRSIEPPSPADQEMRKQRSCSSVRFADEVSSKATPESPLAISRSTEDIGQMQNETADTVPAPSLNVAIETEINEPQIDQVQLPKASDKGPVDIATVGPETELSALPVGILSDPISGEAAKQAESPSKALERAEKKATKRARKRARKQEAKQWEKHMRKERKKRARHRKQGHDESQEAESVQEKQQRQKDISDATEAGNQTVCADKVHEKRHKKKSSKHKKTHDKQGKLRDNEEQQDQVSPPVQKTSANSMNKENIAQPQNKSITKEGEYPSARDRIYSSPLPVRARTPDLAERRPPQTPSSGRSGKSVTAGDEVKSKYFQFPSQQYDLPSSTVPLHSIVTDKTDPHAPSLPSSPSGDAPSDLEPENDAGVAPEKHISRFESRTPSSEATELPRILGEASTNPLITISPTKSPYFNSQPTKSPPKTPTKSPSHLQPNASILSRSKVHKVSPYFPKLAVDPESCLPFPPIDAPSFGLVQEQLAHEPFKLLIATIFLNRTRGGVALPVLFKVFERYPTIDAMAKADQKELVDMIHCLGFQNQRANKCITLAQTWQTDPPSKDKRYRRMHYPRKLDGRDVGRGECIDDEDHRSAWEVAHLPGVGAYSLDSWRIFCRDELRGGATDWKGSGTTDPAFVPEWKSVLPMDKELRAYLTWMWLKEGWEWDHHTGDLKPATEKTLRAARNGGIAHEADGNWVLETSPVKVPNGLHEEDQ